MYRSAVYTQKRYCPYHLDIRCLNLGIASGKQLYKISLKKMFARRKFWKSQIIEIINFSGKLLGMIITHHGADFFKVTFGDTTIAVNPISKDSKLKTTKFGSDITLISLNSPEHNGSENTSRGEKESFVVRDAGEYEISGVFIKGFPSKSEYGGEEKINTIYTVSLEGINLCFLGVLGDSDLSSEVKEGIDGVDILFVPIGGGGVLDSARAHKLAVQFEPKLIIPSHFGELGDKNALKNFLKEAGEESVKPVDKITIKRKDLEGMEGDVTVLEAL